MFLSFPVAVAYAADSSAKANPLFSMAPMILIFVVFYFLLIRPQQKKAKAHKELLSRIEKGDTAVTNGGIYGRVTSTSEDTIMMEIADNIRVKVARNAIATRKPKDG